jgi:hypothetical protein
LCRPQRAERNKPSASQRICAADAAGRPIHSRIPIAPNTGSTPGNVRCEPVSSWTLTSGPRLRTESFDFTPKGSRALRVQTVNGVTVDRQAVFSAFLTNSFS